MMRRFHSPKPGTQKPARMEPMAESIIPLKPNKQRDWESMKDKEVLDFAGRFIDENGIRNKNGLKKADTGLYTILYKRKLLDKVDVEAGKRTWGSDEEVLNTARRFIEENGITNRSGLAKVDYGLYQILKNRKLLGKVKFKKWRRKWGTNDEVLVIARKLIEEKGIPHPSGLMKADSGLYHVLLRRKLLHKVDFEAGKRTWGSDVEVLNTARRFIEENGITNRSGLEKADLGLYQVLRRRKLLDRAFSQMDHASHRRAVQGVLDAMDSFGDDR